MNRLLVVEYNGAGFHGSQRQPGMRTVEGTLLDVLRTITGREPRMVCASRTDSGVHAAGNCFSLELPAGDGSDDWRWRLNALLPADLAVRAVFDMPDSFDARGQARSRRYEYRVLNRRWPSVRLAPYSYLYHPDLDLEAMGRAAASLVGEHDMTSFTPTETEHVHFVRRIDAFEVAKRGDMIIFTIEAESFLRGMVRAAVGTLLEIGKGSRPAGSILETRDARDRRQAGATAPACGLTLLGVRYDRFDTMLSAEESSLFG